MSTKVLVPPFRGYTLRMASAKTDRNIAIGGATVGGIAAATSHTAQRRHKQKASVHRVHAAMHGAAAQSSPDLIGHVNHGAASASHHISAAQHNHFATLHGKNKKVAAGLAVANGGLAYLHNRRMHGTHGAKRGPNG